MSAGGWRRVERILHRTRKPIAAAMLVLAVVIDALAWAGLVAKEEPPVVLHLSTWAIIYTAYTALLVAEDG